MMKSLTIMAALAASAALIAPTVAEASDGASARVSYADLNLAHEAGARTLERRIAQAANVLCGSADHRQLQEFAEVKQCRKDAVAGAQPAFETALRAARRPSVTVVTTAATDVIAR